jgi:hypothetical protein
MICYGSALNVHGAANQRDNLMECCVYWENILVPFTESEGSCQRPQHPANGPSPDLFECSQHWDLTPYSPLKVN